MITKDVPYNADQKICNKNQLGSFTNPLCVWLYHSRLRNNFLVCLVSFLCDDLNGIEMKGMRISRKPIQRMAMDKNVTIRIMDNI